MITIEQLKNKVSKIAEQRPNGFTFNPFKNVFPTKGYVVATSATQDCFGKAGLFKVLKYIVKHLDYCVGGWRNEDGIMQYDASKVYHNVNEAIMAAVADGQRAIFNLYTGKEIMACDYYKYTSAIAA